MLRTPISMTYGEVLEVVITAPTRNRLGAKVPRGFESRPLRQFVRAITDGQEKWRDV